MSAKQSTTAMSSTEAEYIVAAEASMEAVWMRKFIDGLGNVVPSNKGPMEMLCDNEHVIAITNDLGILKGAKHFQRKYHYIREVIQEREIVLKKVHIDDNIADPFTKPMSFNKHFEHAMVIGIVPAIMKIVTNSDLESKLTNLSDQSSVLNVPPQPSSDASGPSQAPTTSECDSLSVGYQYRFEAANETAERVSVRNNVWADDVFVRANAIMWEEELALDSASEDMQAHATEVVKMVKAASWCLQADITERPSMIYESMIKVLEGAMNPMIVG
ncbi:hypothetical protein Tco_1504702 [Tanacetum coccineum]